MLLMISVGLAKLPQRHLFQARVSAEIHRLPLAASLLERLPSPWWTPWQVGRPNVVEALDMDDVINIFHLHHHHHFTEKEKKKQSHAMASAPLRVMIT
jgi:hypothetical protein